MDQVDKLEISDLDIYVLNKLKSMSWFAGPLQAPVEEKEKKGALFMPFLVFIVVAVF